MDGVHDMGGMHGFGKVEPERDEPVFHAEWEARCLALNRAMGAIGAWTIDEARAGIEALPPAVYLANSYYANWALRLQNMIVARGIADADEIARGHALRRGKPVEHKFGMADLPHALTRGSFARAPQAPARFKVGDRVRAKNLHPPTHTRLPRYARGHVGVVEALRGCHVFPDSVAIGAGENPQWLYTVSFDGRELWGEATDPSLTVSIEAFEPYLEMAMGTDAAPRRTGAPNEP
jgi:nitrile hydratase beta subunit